MRIFFIRFSILSWSFFAFFQKNPSKGNYFLAN